MNPLTSPVDIRPDHLRIVQDILREHLPPGVKVWVFGSRANWTTKDSSDLDLALEGESRLDLEIVNTLEDAFEESSLPYTVDIVDIHRVSDRFRRIIESQKASLPGRRDFGKGFKKGHAHEWKTATLGEVVTLQRGFDLPMTKRKLGSYPVIASTGPVGTHNRAPVQAPGVVIGRSGSLGGGQFIKHDFWPLNTTLWVKDFNNNDPRFCYFLLKSLDLERFNVGSGVPTLNRNHIHPLPVCVPPLPEQRAISHILGTLDDKIELNRRMNETLEAMARALFKSWFVNFDPVRAKMEGRWGQGESLPGLPAEHYDLFPDRLVPSELREIPEGWRVKRLGEVADVSSGKRPGCRFPVASHEAQIPLWGGNGPVAFVAEPLVDFPILLTGRVGTLGSVFRITTPCWPSDNTLIVTTKSSQFFNCLFFQMQKLDFGSLNRGSTQPLLTQSDLKTQLLISPPENVLKHFDNLTTRLFDSKDKRREESCTLAAQLDALLPGLLSRKVKVEDSDIENAVRNQP